MLYTCDAFYICTTYLYYYFDEKNNMNSSYKISVKKYFYTVDELQSGFHTCIPVNSLSLNHNYSFPLIAYFSIMLSTANQMKPARVEVKILPRNW